MDFWIKTYSILDRCLYINKYHKEPLYYGYINIYIISGSKQIFIYRVRYIRRHIVHNRDIHNHIDM